MTDRNRPSRLRKVPVWTVVLLTIGAVLTIIGSVLLISGVAAAGGATAQRDGRYLSTPAALFATHTAAITTPEVDGFADTSASRNASFDVGQIRVTADGARPLFIGIAPREDVDRYLASVRHDEVVHVRYDPTSVQYRTVPGAGAAAEDPGAQQFWAESSSGDGRQAVSWRVEPGDWAVVVMNADGTPGVTATMTVGARTDLLAPLAAGFIVGGLVLLVIGIPLTLFGAIGIGRALPDATSPGSKRWPDRAAVAPVRITGRVEGPPSRWLWLVKWILIVPHAAVLAVLWVGFVLATVAAGFAILFTGKYPRPLFQYSVSVLRWSWRVSFYAYSALGTDRYPPFTFGTADYPADLQIDRPERLSRGLVLVKWWLLAFPHYLLLAAFTGGFSVGTSISTTGGWNTNSAPVSVLGVLVLVAAVVLLFTAQYPRGVFDFVLGANRWTYRVAAYGALMRDEYPPFRLDQGPDEPQPPAAHVDQERGSATKR
ncbi:DUF4389 domain-containing protein [Curtobacterium sp. PhB115]|uniref:DUF4389 domain-containing protein n=1 Tax=Curtobacterium sp. PhB115 TaxID=2485173 RepID=UPI000F4C47C2|nr:DUF4389 domain-containing protein [Curtobacterium sp. PhB115]ROP58692.1 uncharacterized protein DUF4389 [Curtobacterium sp. PhB115]